MECLWLSLLLCASVLSISTSVAETYNHGLPLSMSVEVYSVAPSGHHQRHKRQDNLEQLLQCQRLTQAIQCTDGLLQETVNTEVRCNQTVLVQTTGQMCSSNSRGDYCSLAASYVSNVTTATADCADSIPSCTSQCSSSLSFLQDQLGCCINTVYNNSLGLSYMPEAFTHALWSSCSIPPITQVCTPTTIQTPLLPVDPTCTSDVFAQEIESLACSGRYLQPILDAVSAVVGCEAYHRSLLQQCGVDASGQPCYAKRDILASGFATTLSACEDAESCSANCLMALGAFFTTGGCCVNNLFNGSLSGTITPSYTFLSSQFVDRCGLVGPGFCQVRIQNAITTTIPASNTTSDATTRYEDSRGGTDESTSSPTHSRGIGTAGTVPDVLITLAMIVILTLLLPM